MNVMWMGGREGRKKKQRNVFRRRSKTVKSRKKFHAALKSFTPVDLRVE